jgi:DNA polymerase I-like protein with 3'-5' exonuclease and polymerase domains
MEPEKWLLLAQPDCAYFKLNTDGSFQRKKCKCPEHDKLRNEMKPTNFGIPYGISHFALAKQIGKSAQETMKLMWKHEETFDTLWQYLHLTGAIAKMTLKSLDMFGRRRLFPEPTDQIAEIKARKYREEQLRLPEEQILRNKEAFTAAYGRKPTPAEKWILSHKLPSQDEIKSAKMAMYGGIERQGKNHGIQGTNASIAKVAMGAGYCRDGQPYLWHTLRRYKAKLVKFVHDELVIQVPARNGQAAAALIGDAFKRAAAEVMSKVTMEFEYNIADCWMK